MNEAKNESRLESLAQAKSVLLCMDRIVESLSATLRRAGARDVETTFSDRTAQLAVDDEMDEAFTALGEVVAPGAAVTIRGGLVGTETDGQEERKGCALLSITVKGVRTAMDLKKGVRAMLRIIRRYRGALKTRQEQGEIRINLYLPVLRAIQAFPASPLVIVGDPED